MIIGAEADCNEGTNPVTPGVSVLLGLTWLLSGGGGPGGGGG